MDNQVVQASNQSLKTLVKSDAVKASFERMLGENAGKFLSSVLTAVNSNNQLQRTNPMSILSAAAVAASLDLPVVPSLGMAYIVPFGDKATFQLGYRGCIQLAMRTGQYKKITVNPVYEGEIKSFNKFSEEYEFGEKTSDKVVGYLAYIKLVNGFEKYSYMSKEEAEAHGKKYSQTYKKGFGLWKEAFDQMACKTVLKLLVSKYGPLSTEFQLMEKADMGVAKVSNIEDLANIEEADFSYVDNPNDTEAQQEAMDENVKAKILNAKEANK